MKKILMLFLLLWIVNFSYATYYPVSSDLDRINKQTNKFISLIESWKITKEKLLEQLFSASHEASLSVKNKYVINVVINNLLTYKTVDKVSLELNSNLSNNTQRVHWAAGEQIQFISWMDFNTIDKEKLYSKITPYIRNNIALRENNWARMVAYNVIGKESFNWFAKLYIWWVAQEYYQKDWKILKGSLISSPMVLYVKVRMNDFIIYYHEMPTDWENYELSWSHLFPKQLMEVINNRTFLSDLLKSVDNQSISYFATSK